MNNWRILQPLGVAFAITFAMGQTSFSHEQVSYLEQIRPILSDKCFTCHGPDEASREGDLRLDAQEGSRRDLGGYFAIVEGQPAASEVMVRVLEQDPDLRMPPESSGKELSPEEIDVLRNWIDQGAKYETHWAFTPIERPSPPDVAQPDWLGWPTNPIDRFILEKQRLAGLQPSPPADRYQLVRRVYLDLLGIPPTVEEVDAFVGDESPNAYEKLVDRLLASPQYGERWARRWLDLARYADTKGYEKDQPRTMWPYRDWVINAINDDMPFDQFTMEQLAGDMLPSPTTSQLVATGFHRNTMTNEEGGIDPQEFRFLSLVDRVATTGSTWLGMTFGCAQCHTHKYDPITHDDYYRFFAVFNNADELEVEISSESDQLRKQIKAQIDSVKASLRKRFANGEHNEEKATALHTAFNEWLAQEQQSLVRWSPQKPLGVKSNLPTTQVLQDDSILVSGDVTKGDIFTVELQPTGHVAAVRIEALPHQSLPHQGPGRQEILDDQGSGKGNFFLSEVTALLRSPDVTSDESMRLSWKAAHATYVPSGLEANYAIDGRSDTGWTIYGREGKRNCLVLTLSEPITPRNGQKLIVELRHDSFYPASLGRFRISTTDNTAVRRATGHSDEVIAALAIDAEHRSEDEAQLLINRFLEITPLFSEERKTIRELEESMPSPLTALVFEERTSRPRTTRRHHRGEYLKAKEPVSADVPEFLPPLPLGEPANRLVIARWLVERQNPLTARVVVNRWWEAFFGTGLVKTSADFGLQGEYPSHPELLDWLASELVDSGWMRKHLHRIIVTSQTYRQASDVKGEHLAKDPENRLLARMPRIRLEAETVRDTLLRASGLLSSKVGGPSVFPPQPPGITEAAYGPLAWNVSKGEDRYRRGLYTFAKRTSPYAAFGLFDCPSGEACVPRRDRSNTPLQSLNLLNDDVVVEAARSLAMSSCDTSSDPHTIAEYMFRRCVSRLPTPNELSFVVAFFEARLEELRRGELPAHGVLRAGPSQTWTFADAAQKWRARKDVVLKVMGDGVLEVESLGGDPHFGCDVSGPAGEYVLALEASFANEDTAQVFWTTAGQPIETQEHCVTFAVTADKWRTYHVEFDTDDDLRSLRIDPGAQAGVHRIRRMTLTMGDGLVTLPPDVEPARLAAWQLVARALLNLDETITKP